MKFHKLMLDFDELKNKAFDLFRAIKALNKREVIIGGLQASGLGLRSSLGHWGNFNIVLDDYERSCKSAFVRCIREHT